MDKNTIPPQVEIIGVDGDMLWLQISNEALKASAKLLGLSLREMFSLYNKIIIKRDGLEYTLCFDCTGNIGRKIEARLHYDQGIYTIIEIKEVML